MFVYLIVSIATCLLCVVDRVVGACFIVLIVVIVCGALFVCCYLVVLNLCCVWFLRSVLLLLS